MLFNWKLFPGTNLQDLNLDWIINFVKMIPSRLPKFSDHHTWLVYDYSTEEYYDSGEPTGGAGEPGKSPIIGANGNWYTWNTTTNTYTDTGTKAQGVQGEPGAGVASGGAVGNVLIKASGVDYNTEWTATPPQMGAIAHINAGHLADRNYSPGDYLVYNGLLYKVGETAIGSGQALTPGANIDITSIDKIMLYTEVTGVETNVTFQLPKYAHEIYIDCMLPSGQHLSFYTLFPATTYTRIDSGFYYTSSACAAGAASAYADRTFILYKPHYAGAEISAYSSIRCWYR